MKNHELADIFTLGHGERASERERERERDRERDGERERETEKKSRISSSSMNCLVSCLSAGRDVPEIANPDGDIYVNNRPRLAHGIDVSLSKECFQAFE